jgi:hypothetical protein
MSERLTRKELYELAWSEPLSKLGPRFGISGTGFKKTCSRAVVPVPPRGYWAKKQAGKRTVQVPLPPRPPGMQDEVFVSRNGYHGHYGVTDAEILAPLPDPPTFEESIEAVRERARKMIRKAAVPRDFSRAHPAISAFLQEDERRHEKQRSSPFTLGWDKPLVDSPLARRRLRVLNGLLLATARAGGQGHIGGDELEDVSITVHHHHVSLKLASPPPKRQRSAEARSQKGKARGLRLSIVRGFGDNDDRMSWEDGETTLESHVTEIAVEVIVTAEVHYREHCLRIHEWLIERKANLEAKLRKEKAESEQRERERIAALAKARTDRLLAQATSLTQANAVRVYVESVCSAAVDGSVLPDELQQWRAWALEQADRLDPVVSGAFLKVMDRSD